jgi:RNA polymerase sigma-70 factor (ECF subfamily)
MPSTRTDAAAAARNAGWLSLVTRMAAGEQQALGELYDATSPVLYSLALRILRTPEDAEEVVLDTYSRAWRLAAGFDGARASVLTWLIMMARSIAIDRLRSRTAKTGNTTSLEAELVERSDSSPSPESAALFAGQRARVRTALDQLTPEQRQAVELAFFEGLTHSELADRLGIPLGTAKTRVRLGLNRLRQLLGSAP